MKRKTQLLFGGSGSFMLILIAAMLLVVLPAQSGSASHIQSSPAHSVNQYSSKFLCGTIASPASAFQVLAPGTYNTAVNIHNANDFAVTIQKKGVISVAESAPAPNQGFPSGRRTEVLQPDASMEVDCAEIVNILNNSSPPASPGCALGLPGATSFCKGYLVVEAARIYQPVAGGIFVGVPAQLDVTDILTVKEEDGIWKDYTFIPRCIVPSCQPLNYFGRPVLYDFPYNLPFRPPIPQCYYNHLQPCDIYDVDDSIRQTLQPFQTSAVYQIQLVASNMATDSRDVSLDFEFVSPKVVRYNCWPKGNAACP